MFSIKSWFFPTLLLIRTFESPGVSDTYVKLSSPESQGFRCYCESHLLPKTHAETIVTLAVEGQIFDLVFPFICG